MAEIECGVCVHGESGLVNWECGLTHRRETCQLLGDIPQLSHHPLISEVVGKHFCPVTAHEKVRGSHGDELKAGKPIATAAGPVLTTAAEGGCGLALSGSHRLA